MAWTRTNALIYGPPRKRNFRPSQQKKTGISIYVCIFLSWLYFFCDFSPIFHAIVNIYFIRWLLHVSFLRVAILIKTNLNTKLQVDEEKKMNFIGINKWIRFERGFCFDSSSIRTGSIHIDNGSLNKRNQLIRVNKLFPFILPFYFIFIFPCIYDWCFLRVAVRQWQ